MDHNVPEDKYDERQGAKNKRQVLEVCPLEFGLCS